MPLKSIYNKDFFIKDNCIHLSTDYFAKNSNRFKKITGSRLAAILNKNQYTSPLKTWMMMTNIYYEEMDETLSKVGNAIEPKLKEYIEKKLHIKYKQYNPFEVKWDVFSDNEIFGGIPDGEPVDNSGNFLYSKNFPMIEIKTTSIDSFVYKNINGVLTMQKDENEIPLIKKINGKIETWFDDDKNLVVPLEYQLQLCLYMYLRKVNYGLIVVGFLKKEDYAKPILFNPDERKIETAKIELDLNKFDPIIKTATNWYNKYIKTGISPEFSEKDLKWFNELIK